MNEAPGPSSSVGLGALVLLFGRLGSLRWAAPRLNPLWLMTAGAVAGLLLG